MCQIANHGRVVRRDTMLTVVFVGSLVSGVLLCISGCRSQAEGPITARAEKPQSPGLEREMVRYKECYGGNNRRHTDAVCGFVRGAVQGQPAMQALFEQAKRVGVCEELSGE